MKHLVEAMDSIRRRGQVQTLPNVCRVDIQMMLFSSTRAVTIQKFGKIPAFSLLGKNNKNWYNLLANSGDFSHCRRGVDLRYEPGGLIQNDEATVDV